MLPIEVRAQILQAAQSDITFTTTQLQHLIKQFPASDITVEGIQCFRQRCDEVLSPDNLSRSENSLEITLATELRIKAAIYSSRSLPDQEITTTAKRYEVAESRVRAISTRVYYELQSTISCGILVSGG